MDFEYGKLKQKLDTPQGKALFSVVKRLYEEECEGKPVDALTYRLFQRYAQDGNRGEYETTYFAKTTRLNYLSVLALADDKYLVDLEDILAVICDTFTWILPAHAYIEEEKRNDYRRIDLFACELAFIMCEVYHVFEQKLSNDIKQRILSAVQSKVLDHYEKKEIYLWWEEAEMNWSAVCACSLAIAMIYCFPKKFEEQKERIFASLQCFMRGFEDDGLCKEGVDYWCYGFGTFLMFLDVYKQAFGDLPDVAKTQKVKNVLDYYMNAYIDGYALPFADANSEKVEHYPFVELVAKKTFPDDFELSDYDFFDFERNFAKQHYLRFMHEPFRYLDCIGRFDAKGKAKTIKEKSVYYANSQVFLRKTENYSFVAKGGFNQEPHNHNDIGTFAIYKGGKRYVTDLGSGEYTRQYFNAERYGDGVFVCNSSSHNVPIINGEYQKFGKDYRGKLLAQSENELKLDISGAYGMSDGTMTVDFVCAPDNVKIAYKKDEKATAIYRFICVTEPKIIKNGIAIDGVKFTCDKDCEVNVTSREYSAHLGERRTAWLADFAPKKNESDVSFVFDAK